MVCKRRRWLILVPIFEDLPVGSTWLGTEPPLSPGEVLIHGPGGEDYWMYLEDNEIEEVM